jgi:hypothetical protein
VSARAFTGAEPFRAVLRRHTDEATIDRLLTCATMAQHGAPLREVGRAAILTAMAGGLSVCLGSWPTVHVIEPGGCWFEVPAYRLADESTP